MEMSVYHNLDSIQEIHVEVTNRCNAACPMCARNHFGGRQKSFDLTEWEREDGDRVFSSSLKNLRNVLFCGTHGDPAMASHSLNFVESVKRHPKATIEFYSNGSVRSKNWWKDLGGLLCRQVSDDHYRKSDLGIFSIDGLEDTNPLYRRQTNFLKIMENAEVFIQAGGIARWDFIVFKHNEHQVEQAQALAKKMGFKQFRIRKTSRFSYSPDGLDKHRVLDKDGNIEYYLEPPSRPEYRNPIDAKLRGLFIEGREDHMNSVEIRCQNKSAFQRIYVNSFLEVHPCCFIANDIYPARNFIAKDTKEKVFERLGEFNSLRRLSWEEILSHPFYREELVKSWEKGNPGGRLLRCLRTCGKDLSPILSQSKDIGVDKKTAKKNLFSRFVSKFTE